MSKRRSVLAALAAAACGRSPGGAQTPAPLEIGYALLNPSAQEWPLLIAQAQGFFLNSTHFDWTTSEVRYGQRISQLLGGAHFSGVAPSGIASAVKCR